MFLCKTKVSQDNVLLVENAAMRANFTNVTAKR